MIEPNNDRALLLKDNPPLAPKGSQSRYTAETVLRTRPKTYRKIVHLLADPYWSVLEISKACRVSEHTVRTIREREAVAIAERKQRLISLFGNVAEMSAERMEELCGKASLRDAGVSAGIATDKMLALLGERPCASLEVALNLDDKAKIQEIQCSPSRTAHGQPGQAVGRQRGLAGSVDWPTGRPSGMVQ
jgi:hypothetical protein